MALAILQVDTVMAAAMRASRSTGASVDNDSGESTGSIDDLMLTGDPIQFAILPAGGFLGIGAHLVAVPFDSLLIGEDGVMFPGATRDELKRLTKVEYR